MRQTIGFIQSLLKLAGLDWSIPDYSKLFRRQQTLQVRIPYQKSPGALHRQRSMFDILCAPSDRFII